MCQLSASLGHRGQESSKWEALPSSNIKHKHIKHWRARKPEEQAAPVLALNSILSMRGHSSTESNCISSGRHTAWNALLLLQTTVYSAASLQLHRAPRLRWQVPSQTKTTDEMVVCQSLLRALSQWWVHSVFKILLSTLGPTEHLKWQSLESGVWRACLKSCVILARTNLLDIRVIADRCFQSLKYKNKLEKIESWHLGKWKKIRYVIWPVPS